MLKEIFQNKFIYTTQPTAAINGLAGKINPSIYYHELLFKKQVILI